MKHLLKFAPAPLAGLVVAIFFQHHSTQSIILATGFAGLVTLVIAQADTINKLQSKNEEQDLFIEALAENTTENFKVLSQAMDDDLKSLASEVGTELHELALLIAEHKFGEEE